MPKSEHDDPTSRASQELGDLSRLIESYAQSLRELDDVAALAKHVEEYASQLRAAQSAANELQRTYNEIADQHQLIIRNDVDQSSLVELAELFRRVQQRIIEQKNLLAVSPSPLATFESAADSSRQLQALLAEQRLRLSSKELGDKVIVQDTLKAAEESLAAENKRLKSATMRGSAKLLQLQRARYASQLRQRVLRRAAETHAQKLLLGELQNALPIAPRALLDRIASKMADDERAAAPDAPRRVLWRLVRQGRVGFTDDRRVISNLGLTTERGIQSSR